MTRTVINGMKWLADANAPYAEGLKQAEIAVIILEANQLAQFRELPSHRVAQLSGGEPDPKMLREFFGRVD